MEGENDMIKRAPDSPMSDVEEQNQEQNQEQERAPGPQGEPDPEVGALADALVDAMPFQEDVPAPHSRGLPVLRGPGPPYAVWTGPWLARKDNVLQGVVSAGGTHDEPLVGRAYLGGRLLPARVDPRCLAADIEWEGALHPADFFEVLVVVRGTVEWMAAADGDVPAQALPVGLGLDNETVYVARVFCGGKWRLGRLMPSEGACVLVDKEDDLAFKEYEVLVIGC